MEKVLATIYSNISWLKYVVSPVHGNHLTNIKLHLQDTSKQTEKFNVAQSSDLSKFISKREHMRRWTL